MLTMTIHAIQNNRIFSKADWDWIVDNLGCPLRVASIVYFGNEVSTITVYKNVYDDVRLLIPVASTHLKCTLVGTIGEVW